MQERIEVCGDCHDAIHRLVPDEKQLGRELNTLESLRAYPPLARFVAWVQKQR